MNRLTSISGLKSLQGPLTLAIGVFDGVHLGHQAVLKRALADAKHAGGKAVAITFNPHPARILRPEAAPRLLTSTPHKLRLIENLGYEHALVITFDAAMAATPAPVFLESLQKSCRNLAGIVVGCGWAFGKNREGSVDLIRQTGIRAGFQAVEIPAFQMDEKNISSTRIRKAVEVGDFETARRCLGRPYSILGTVIKGRQLGQTIGFPTANLRAHNEQFPPDGVYAIQTTIHGSPYRGVANIGVRPTVETDGERLLEVHILDYHGDLYHQDIEISFLAHLRKETKFASLADLKTQIARDIKAADSIPGE